MGNPILILLSWGRQWRNGRPIGRNFTLNGTQGEVGVSFFFFFLGRLFFILSVASKLTENAVILRYKFSLSDWHFSLILLEGEFTSPYCQGPT